jgi:hypothetical protein
MRNKKMKKIFTLYIYVEEEDNQNSNRQQENQERAGNQDLEEDQEIPEQEENPDIHEQEEINYEEKAQEAENCRPRQTIKQPARLQDYVMEDDSDYDEALLTYIEVTEGPEKKKWLNAIKEEK